MCMTPQIPAPEAPIIPESVKRVATDQRRAVENNNANAAAAASATNKTGGMATPAIPSQKKSLLGA
jgi:hypothetical protein